MLAQKRPLQATVNEKSQVATRLEESVPGEHSTIQGADAEKALSLVLAHVPNLWDREKAMLFGLYKVLQAQIQYLCLN